MTCIYIQFIGGAGKFFEGTPSQMYASLYGKLATLPPNTKVYCGHEVRRVGLAHS
jgi:hydroxyacylglutathione hydrolase